MTNDIEKIQTVDNEEHGLKLDSGILSYIRTGITNVKQALDALFSGKADTNHTHTKSQITDFAHTHSQSDVTGLSDELANKLSSNVTVYNMPSDWTPKNLSTMVTGNLYLFVNNPRARLDAIINNDEDVTLNYHQNAGSTTNEFIMVRIYRWASISSGVYALCEIVGAWDSPSN